MARIRIIGKNEDETCELFVKPDNTLSMDYVRSIFPGAIGLKYSDPGTGRGVVYVYAASMTSIHQTFYELSL